MPHFPAGTIIIVDWRCYVVPKEPDKLRPAIIVENDELFESGYPNVILVPLACDSRPGLPSLSVVINPTPENGCMHRPFAIALMVIAASIRRIRETPSRITDTQLRQIRQPIARAIGLS